MTAVADRVARIFNGTYTIESTATGKHRTFSIRTQKDEAKFAPGERVIGLLTGADNEDDYTGFGFVSDDGISVWRSKLGHGYARSKFEVYATILWELATRPEGYELGQWYAQGYRLHVERRCIKCNRKLTTPASLKTGIGPICAGRTDS